MRQFPRLCKGTETTAHSQHADMGNGIFCPLISPGPQLCPPGLCPYLRSGNWRASRQVVPALQARERRGEVAHSLVPPSQAGT